MSNQNLGQRISELPTYYGVLKTDGYIPITILGVTYKIKPIQIGATGGGGVVGLWEPGTITSINSIQQPGNTASGDNSLAVGNSTQATGYSSYSEGEMTIASGEASHAEGYDTQATGDASHAEGVYTQAIGEISHAEGISTWARGYASHAEGNDTQANGDNSHVEGNGGIASGTASHAEGDGGIASGDASHSEGQGGEARGIASHSGGIESYAFTLAETVIGHYSDIVSGASGSFDVNDPVFRVGIGLNNTSTKDGFRVYKGGAIKLTPTDLTLFTPIDGMIAIDNIDNQIKLYFNGSWSLFTNEDLQQVLLNGNASDQEIKLLDNLESPTISNSITSEHINISNSSTNQEINIDFKNWHMTDGDSGNSFKFETDSGITLINNGNGFETQITNFNSTDSIQLVVPNKANGSYVIATIDDIPTNPTYSVPGLDDVLAVNGNAIDKTISLTSTSGGRFTNIVPAQINMNDDSNDYNLNLQPGYVNVSKTSTNKYVITTEEGFRFRFNSSYSNLKPNPSQISSAEPTFWLPKKDTTANYTLVTQDDLTIPPLQSVTNVSNTTNNGIQFQPVVYGGTGTGYISIDNNLISVSKANQNGRYIKADMDQWTDWATGNTITISATAAAAAGGATFVYPSKPTGSPFTIATTADLINVTSYNNNTLLINSTSTTNKVFNTRGLTSSNGSVIITSTGSNTSSNWNWDLKVTTTVGATGATGPQGIQGATGSTGATGSSYLYPLTLDSYTGTRLTPTGYNGFNVFDNINKNLGISIINQNTGNGAIANITLSGTSSTAINGGGLAYYSSGYYVPYLQGNTGLYSFSDLFIYTSNGKSIDFRTGNTWGDETSKFKINNNGQLSIGVTPSTDNTATDIILRKSDGSVVISNKSNITSNLVPYSGANTNINIGTYSIYANSYFNGFSSITASGTLITLTLDSNPVYYVTGSGGQTIKLPNATTLPLGAVYSFNNNQSSGSISVNNTSNTLVKSVPSGGYLTLELIDNTTTTGLWDAHFETPSNSSWSTNTLDWSGSIINSTWNGNIIGLNRGGSNANLTANPGAIVYSSTASMALSSVGTIGQVLTSQGTNAPIWTSLTYSTITNALGYVPYNASNPASYTTTYELATFTASVAATYLTIASASSTYQPLLGYTPYNSTNPTGYVTASIVDGYLTSVSASNTYLTLKQTQRAAFLKI